jgi:hypothetical protein
LSPDLEILTSNPRSAFLPDPAKKAKKAVVEKSDKKRQRIEIVADLQRIPA